VCVYVCIFTIKKFTIKDVYVTIIIINDDNFSRK